MLRLLSPKKIFKNILLFLPFFILSCQSYSSLNHNEEQSISKIDSKDLNLTQKEEANPSLKEKIDPQDQFINALYDSMTVEQRVGQLFILSIRHTAFGQPATKMDDYIANFISKYKPGGIILFSINLKDKAQTSQFINELQSQSSIPLFITTDEEGGSVSRLGKNSQMEVISLPSAKLMGKKTPQNAEKNYALLGAQMKQIGFNLDMAPVADLSRGYIAKGGRGFSQDPQINSQYVTAAVRGLNSQSIGATLKHFPGLGNSYGDTHKSRVSSTVHKEVFYNEDFIPFEAGINAGAQFVLVSHLSVPSLDPSELPASLSYTIQSQILKKQLGFKGLIISDAMDMKAISANYSSKEASLKAYRAGTDIILMPSHIPTAQKAIKEALLGGEISELEFESRIKHILKVKMDLNIIQRFNFKEEIDNLN